jgi:uncharacterized membrane protein
MVAATLSLLGLLLSIYLWLWKLGVLGSIACGTGSCEYVQTSSYSDFLGVPVPLIGVGGYLSLLLVSLVGVQPRWADHPAPTRLLAGLAGVGVAFSAYLTWIEAAVLNAWCRWCVASAVIITAVFVTALVGLRGNGKRETGNEAPPAR